MKSILPIFQQFELFLGNDRHDECVHIALVAVRNSWFECAGVDAKGRARLSDHRGLQVTEFPSGEPAGASVSGQLWLEGRVRVAYLRGVGRQEDLQTSMNALESAGCDRVVFDSTPRNRPESSAALNAFLARMKPGDSLVVTDLDQLGSATQRLLDRLADLIERGIRVETLSGELDTGEPSVASTVKALCAFDRKARTHRAPAMRSPEGDNSPGRPRRLAGQEVARAREMVEIGGRPIAEVARALGVSRATLYRSLRRS